jgi:hypothetical protein
VHDLGVEVQELGHGRVGLGGGVVLSVLVVMAFHARQPTFTLRY